MFFDSTPSPSARKQDTVIDMLGQDTFLDRYEILSCIGEGGFGAVYKARHNLIGRTVAIKFLHEPVPDEVSMRRFRVEAQAAASLTHPNIVTVYDFGVAPDNQLYLIMDFVEGTSLLEAIGDAEHLEVDRAINIFIQTCDALEHAHKRGIIHRDLKPSNIMLADDEYDTDFVKIVDFGLAKFMTGDGQNEKLTQTGELLGTPFYISPEQCRGEAPDHRSDIYSLGCIMYRVLSGQLPISGKNVLSTVYQHISKAPLSFAETAPELDIPPALEKVVFKALQKDPADRYQSMAEVGADLRNVRKARGRFASRSVSAFLPGNRMVAWIAATVLILLAAAIGLLSTRDIWSVAPRSATAESQPGNRQPALRPTTKPVEIKQATASPSANTGMMQPAKRGPVRQVTSRAVPDRGEIHPSAPQPVPPPVAPDRYAANTATNDGAYDRSPSYSGAGREPTQGYTTFSSSSSSGRKRGKKGNKHGGLAKAIGSVAGEFLTDSASGVGKAGSGLGHQVGRYGKFIKDLVNDH